MQDKKEKVKKLGKHTNRAHMYMYPRRENTYSPKSANQQYIWREVSADPDVLAQLLASKTYVDPDLFDELEALRSELHTHLINSLPTLLTQKQFEIFDLWRTGKYTQVEIAAMIGVDQTTVFKSINGNTDYGDRVRYPNGKMYGGSMRKLKIWQASDPICQELLQKIADIQSQIDDSE